MASISPQKTLPEPPYKASLTDQNGMMTQAWAAFVRQLFLRVGGQVAYSNLDLANLQAADLTTLNQQVAALTQSIATLGDNGLGLGRTL